MRHDPRALAAFQDGERCLVWARYRDGGELYRLADGDARAVKAWAKEHLECFMPDCSDRRLTTVARHPRRRDGFSHYAGSGRHSAEGEAHQQAKVALRAWVQDTLGGHGVSAVLEQASADRSRVADVMVTWPDGRQVALEVQYAALTVEQWRQRHESYRQQGITAVWLLGHQGPHLRTARPRSWEVGEPPDGAAIGATDGVVALGDLHSAMLQAGVPLLWINPVWGDSAGIATLAVTTAPHRSRRGAYGDGYDDRHGHDVHFEVPPGSEHRRAAFHVDPLSTCTLTPNGLQTPTLQRLSTTATLLASIDAARRGADAARAAAEAEARRVQRAHQHARAAAHAQRTQEQRERRYAQDLADGMHRQQQREAQQRSWDTSELKQRVLARYDGTIPRLLSIPLSSEDDSYTPFEHWRAAIYKRLIWNKTGRSFTIGDAVTAIQAEGVGGESGSARPRLSALSGWLEHLHRLGYLDLERDPQQQRVLRARVLGDLDHPPTPAALTAPAAPPAAPTAPSEHEQQQEGRGEYQGQERIGESTVRADTDRSLRCHRCNLPLDPLLAGIGLHVMCWR